MATMVTAVIKNYNKSFDNDVKSYDDNNGGDGFSGH